METALNPLPPALLPAGPSLRSRFALFGAAVAVLTAATLGGYLVWTAGRDLREQALRDQLLLARSLASRVDQGVAKANLAVAALAQRREALRLEPVALGRDLALVTRRIELLDALVVIDRQGRLVAHGQPWRPELLPPPGLYFKDRALLLAGAGVLTDLYRDGNGDAAVCIRAPVLRGGHLLGVVAGVLRLPRHGVGGLDEAQVGRDGHAYLVSQDGQALLPPKGPHTDEDRRDQARLAPQMVQPEGVLEFSVAGAAKVQAAWARLPLSGWTVVLCRPAAETFAPAARMLRSMTLFVGLAGLLAAAAALWAAGKVAAPIEQLTRRVRQFDASAPAVESEAGGDVVLHLSRALDAMTRRLSLRRKQRDAAHRRALSAERKLAENARLASLGELAAGLAHELNNPLTVIQGAAQVLEGCVPAEAPGWTAEILRETARCRRLVADLLDLARPGQVQPEALSLKALCLETWQHLPARERGWARLRLPRRDLRVQADPLRLKQVLGNLMRNALQTKPPTKLISVDWSRRGALVRVQLSDRGPGLGPDPEALFKPFYTTKAKGTGLGLAIARALMRAHGGRLWAEPAPGGGARFTAEWPSPPASPPAQGRP